MKIPLATLLSVIPQQKWSYRCHFNESIDVRLAIVLPVVLGICCFIIKPWHPQSEQVSSSSSHWIPHQTWDLKCSLPVTCIRKVSIQCQSPNINVTTCHFILTVSCVTFTVEEMKFHILLHSMLKVFSWSTAPMMDMDIIFGPITQCWRISCILGSRSSPKSNLFVRVTPNLSTKSVHNFLTYPAHRQMGEK